MEESTPKVTTAGKWAQRLRGRSRMAVAAIGGVFLVGFVGVSRPLGQRIDTANDRLGKAEARMVLAGEVNDLRRQASLYQKKLPRGVDPSDWTNYLLTGIRGERVKLVRMDPKDMTSIGPCKVLSWQVDLEGDLESLGRVVEWLENGKRLVRIDRVVLQNVEGRLVMSMLVKGLALDVPIEQQKGQKDPEIRKVSQQASRPKAGDWIEENSGVKLPENLKLPGGLKLPDAEALSKAMAEAK